MSENKPIVKSSFNTIWIKQNIESIKQEICKMELNGVASSFDFEMSILESHAEFYQQHPFLVKKLCKREDISFLYKMLDKLNDVEAGTKSLASVELKLGEDLANQYLYPVINKQK